MSSYKKINVVVPIYRGQHYIKGIISQIENCAEKVYDAARVELILINDDPDDCFQENFLSKKIDIVMVEAEQNRGIQGTRVKGLSYCAGDYVVFLDQDDRLFPNYFKSQLEMLGDADAVVCKAKENGREVYNATYPFFKTVDFLNMISVGNTIVSPGQVLIRREAIPNIWKRNILQNSGADDWFLWICMMQKGCKFVLNDKILFEHRLEGNNCSWDSEKMILSEKEMLEVIKRESLLNEIMYKKIKDVIELEQQRYIYLLEKYRKMFFIYDKWMELECRIGSMSGYLYGQRIRKVAVYGMGYIGMQLVNRLRDANIFVVKGIDRNAEYINVAIPVVRLEKFNDRVDLVIVTVMDNIENILWEIKGQLNAPVITIHQLLESWEQEGEILYE
ncbi:MAG: glycosyltransferase [Roseburia sp.]|nr:glycosyltransferase [Roseburia sp.]